jgi:hypothetical protein
MQSFFQRVVHYVINEVLVDTLANSKAFQRFAVRSNAYFSEVSKKGVESKEGFADKSGEFLRALREELRNGGSTKG